MLPKVAALKEEYDAYGVHMFILAIIKQLKASVYRRDQFREVMVSGSIQSFFVCGVKYFLLTAIWTDSPQTLLRLSGHFVC